MPSSCNSTAKLKIETVDQLRLTLAGRETRLTSRKAKAVLGYLLLNETPTASREQLVGLLWSEADEERARGSLRHCVKELRVAFRGTEFTGLSLGKQTIKLDPATIDVDLWQVLDAAKAGRAHGRLLDVAGLTDHLLVDLESVDPVFQTWVSAKRRSINQKLLRHLEDALRVTSIDHEHCEALARAIINLDPTHEEACRSLMQVRAHHGDIGGALKAYTALFDLLDEEYDVEPTEQTQALFAELKAKLPFSGGPDLAGATMAEDLARTRPSNTSTKLVLSIERFPTVSIAPEWRYLVNGFRAELITYLTRFREWIVREDSGGEAGAAMSDEYVLSVETAPLKQGARLWLQLRERASNGYLWSERADLETVDWGDTQQSLVRRIAAALNIHVSAGRLAQIGPKSSTDLLAFDLWLRGQAHQFTLEPKGIQAAEAIYKDIVAQYPGFAPAYSSLAQIYNSIHFAYPGRFRTAEITADAQRFASSAVRLDPMDSRSQLALGWANAMAGQHDLAAVHHDLAVELNASDPWTLVSGALGAALRDDTADARRLADHAALVSMSASGIQWRYQAMIRYLISDFSGCLSAAARAEHSIQNVLVWKAAALVELGRLDEATEAVEAFFHAAEARWLNEERAPDRRNIAMWFLHAFPFKSQAAWERLRDNFGRAGAPVEGLEHADLCPVPSHAHAD